MTSTKLTVSSFSWTSAVVTGVGVVVLGTFAWRRRKRRLLEEEKQLEHDLVSRCKDKCFAVTGSNTGIGYEIAKELAIHGAHVLLLCRNEAKALDAMDQMRRNEAKTLKLDFIALDLSSFQSIRKCAATINNKYPALHGLVNNAGIFHIPKYTKAEESGYELTWTVNHLGPFLLAEQLQPILMKSSRQFPTRVVNLSSTMHKALFLDDISSKLFGGKQEQTDLPSFLCAPQPENYSVTRAYAASKACQIMHAFELNKRFAPNIQGFSVDPGLIRTSIARHQNWFTRELTYFFLTPIRKTPQQGAAHVLHCLVSEQAVPGRYYSNGHVEEPLYCCQDPVMTKALWELDQQFCGIDEQ